MDRKSFLIRSGMAALGAPLAGTMSIPGSHKPGEAEPMTLFLSGDVMTGRGIDQVLPHPGDPQLYESYVKDAGSYVDLAERHSGPIPDEVSFDYVWGDALAELERVAPQARIINLETAVTTSNDRWSGKRIHYRMHPRNTPLLSAAGIDICVLGNNHTLDWGYAGLRETLETLHREGLATAGAGIDRSSAAEPAVLNTDRSRLLLFSYATPGAGAPLSWSAEKETPGLNLLTAVNQDQARRVIRDVETRRRKGDRVVVSLHWGGNWGYEIPRSQRDFARQLIDAGAADIIHGHSSHHPKGIEVYEGRPVLYGCGDLINDYEGIGGHEEYRSELSLMYFPVLDGSGTLIRFEMAPMKMHRFRLKRTAESERKWLTDRMNRECRELGTSVATTQEGRLTLRWQN